MSKFRSGKNLYIDRRDDGMYGLFASQYYNEDEPIILITNGDKQDEGDLYSIEVDDGHYFHPYGRYTNHSCDPSAYVDRKSGFLFAKRYIGVDDEITFNYLDSETNVKANFHFNFGRQNWGCKIGTDK